VASTRPTTDRAPRPAGTARRRLLLAPAVCALVVAVASACGSSGDTASAGTTSSAGSSSTSSGASSSMPATATEIMIEDFEYTTPASVSPGATVSVMNMDAEAHTVTADSGDAFDVKATPGSTVTFTAPTTPGSYEFHCTYHSNMHGVLVVK
jgi:plastocyanin